MQIRSVKKASSRLFPWHFFLDIEDLSAALVMWPISNMLRVLDTDQVKGAFQNPNPIGRWLDLQPPCCPLLTRLFIPGKLPFRGLVQVIFSNNCELSGFSRKPAAWGLHLAASYIVSFMYSVHLEGRFYFCQNIIVKIVSLYVTSLFASRGQSAGSATVQCPWSTKRLRAMLKGPKGAAWHCWSRRSSGQQPSHPYHWAITAPVLSCPNETLHHFLITPMFLSWSHPRREYDDMT